VEPPKALLEFPPKPQPEDFFRSHAFEEPLVPVGPEPTEEENAALAAALMTYSHRASVDDFSSLTAYVKQHPASPWSASLLTVLGIEYYNTAHFSLALEAWTRAWSLAKDATDLRAKALADRAVGELGCMYARLGRMSELEPLLQSVENRVFIGPGAERISGARGGLSNMKTRPEIAFRCGPLALHRIKLAFDPAAIGPATRTIMQSASTQRGFALTQVAQLSKEIGFNYQMAFREKGAAFVVPSVIHWKVGHYAAIIREEDGRYLLQDPTFRNDIWSTRAALEEEASGYFLIPRGPLAAGWRAVGAEKGSSVWGKGNVGGPDLNSGGGEETSTGDAPDPGGDTPFPPCPPGMAVSSMDLLQVSLTLSDVPVGYDPPVGPAVYFLTRYNQRDPFQAANFSYSNFGSKWTFQWLAYITDNPFNLAADVQYYRMAGFSRLFTGFSPATQSYAIQQYDHTRLTRTSPTSYEMLSPDGSKRIFSLPDGSIGTSRKVFLTQLVDPAGNTLSITYDTNLRVIAITDAIGQVTTLSYENSIDIFKITKVTDPFGRFATFDYDSSGRLSKITDVIGMASQFAYDPSSDFVHSLTTPYGTTTFTKAEGGTFRSLERLFPDGNRDRAEFNQSTSLGIGASDPPASLPTGMATHNDYLYYRNTYYWSKIACAQAYGDYSKAKIYHWLHTADLASAAGTLESTKEALEGRVWRDYIGQSDPIIVSTNTRPAHVGRVLDDGTTQLYSFQYNSLGKVTQMLDPLGRTFSYLYATNDVDLLEIRQTRAGNNDLLFQATYNAQHLRLTSKESSGQTTTRTYNARGQLLTETNPKGETISNYYDTNGYLLRVDGALPGTNDSIAFTYDALGRVRTYTDEDGYALTFAYDVLDRLTTVTHPDGTFEQLTYDRLDFADLRDRAGRHTTFEHNGVRQLTKRTDPLNRSVLYEWCKCGSAKRVTDALGRTTTWQHDVQGRLTGKTFADGTGFTYLYENKTSRRHQKIDEKLQITQYSYNRDDTLSAISYGNALVPTASVTFNYDLNYRRLTAMTDGTGTTRYTYNPITGTPSIGAGAPASIDGPLPNDTVSYNYDELDRRVSTAVNGTSSLIIFDAAHRIIARTNVLGSFSYAYDGPSRRLLTTSHPNGQTATRAYFDNLSDRRLQRLTHTRGLAPISEFIHAYDTAAARMTNWSQQVSNQTPLINALAYDAANQLTSATGSVTGTVVKTFAYAYDPAGNRLIEQIDGASNSASYNILNELTSADSGSAINASYEWDAENRLTAINAGTNRTEFTYDGMGRRTGIRELTNGVEMLHRRFVWSGSTLVEERTPAGQVVKRFFPQGVQVVTGPFAGQYFYTRDHLGSIREVVDTGGTVRARFSYEPYGARVQTSGNLDADFGFAGYFYHGPSGLYLTRFRAYDPRLGRWLSREPLNDAERRLGPNLFAYANNEPVSHVDPLGTTPILLQSRLPGWLAWLILGGHGHPGHGGVISETVTYNPPPVFRPPPAPLPQPLPPPPPPPGPPYWPYGFPPAGPTPGGDGGGGDTSPHFPGGAPPYPCDPFAPQDGDGNGNGDPDANGTSDGGSSSDDGDGGNE
jgi:RHS repeat-associated protein